MKRKRLVFCPGSWLPKWASNPRCRKGALTQEYSQSFEEAQRSQRREGPANLVANFRGRTLAFWIVVQAAFAALLLSGVRQAPQQPAEQQQEQPAAPLPRVVGQTRTPEEWQAWKEVVEAPAAAKPQAAQQFLKDFPDSGMTPHAHWMIARDAFQKGDYTSFTMHGEATVKELPQALDVLSQLSFYYAETNQFDRAVQHAGSLLSAVGTLNDPQGLPPDQFARSRDQMAGQGNYALGRSELGRYKADPKSALGDRLLGQAIQHLEKAVSYDPSDGYAYFRLGEAHQFRNELEQACQNYALAATVGGAVAGPARSSIEVIYQALQKDPSQIDALIEQQRGVLQARVQSKEEEYRQAGSEQQPPGNDP